MVRTTGLLSLLRRIPRFTTPSRPGAAAACYVALWRLPRPDFHRLVIRTFHGAPATCYTPVNGWLPTRVSLATRHALAELLGKRDNDALRPADVG